MGVLALFLIKLIDEAGSPQKNQGSYRDLEVGEDECRKCNACSSKGGLRCL